MTPTLLMLLVLIVIGSVGVLVGWELRGLVADRERLSQSSEDHERRNQP